MDRQNTGVEKAGSAPSPPRFRKWLPAMVLLGLATLTPAFADIMPSMKVEIPEAPHQGKVIKVRVTFSTRPPRGDFYRLEADIDNTPVALSDLSEESSLWVTLPAQTAGAHTLSVIWRNFPGKSPLIRKKTLQVLP
jgi:hypothetical protein